MLRRPAAYSPIDSDARMERTQSVEFAAASLYLPGLQTVFATVAACVVSILTNWVVPPKNTSAVRTLFLTSCVGLLLVLKPVRVGHARGVEVVFSALRPSLAVYTASLVVAQLSHTCVVPDSNFDKAFFTGVLFNASLIVSMLASIARSASPRSENDFFLLVAAGAMAVTALVPPAAVPLSGPLCAPSTLTGAGEQVVRAFLFSTTNTILVYASAPLTPDVYEILLCVSRSAGVSVWILGVSAWFLPFALLQMCVIVYFTFASTPPVDKFYNSVADVESAFEVALKENRSDVESEVSETNEESSLVAAAARTFRKQAANAINGSDLNFSLGGPLTDDQLEKLANGVKLKSVA